MHSKNMYAKHIRKWLNHEWKRLEKGKVNGNVAPFAPKSMPSLSPKSKAFYLFAVVLFTCLLKLISSYPLSYQFHTRQMGVIVVCLFADMHTTYS